MTGGPTASKHPILSNETTSSFVQIPDEILAEIFWFCINPAVASAPSHAPMLPCQVCHRWRKVALETPRLWNHLFIRNKGKIYPEECARFVLDWTLRAGTLPLHMTIYDVRGHDYQFNQKEFLGRLVSTDALVRCEALHLVLGTQDANAVFTHFLNTPTPARMPNLRVFHMRSEYREDADGIDFLVSNLSAVEEVIISHANVTVSLDGLITPLLTLRHLECALAEESLESYQKFRLLPNIEVLKCHFWVPSPSLDHPATSEVVLDRLHTLSLTSHWFILPILLTLFRFPMLKDLTIKSFRSSKRDLNDTPIHLASFLQRCGASLQSLRVDWYNPEELLSCFECSSSIEHISGGAELVDLLNSGKFTAMDGTLHTPICPNLELVEFTDRVFHEVNLDRLLELVSTRSRFSRPSRDPRRTLHTIRFHSTFNRRYAPDWFFEIGERVKGHPSFQEHFSNGFKFEMTFSDE